MPYLTRIGPFSENKSGVGARVYPAYGLGKKVFAVWGGIEVRPGRRFFWTHPAGRERDGIAFPETSQYIERKIGRNLVIVRCDAHPSKPEYAHGANPLGFPNTAAVLQCINRLICLFLHISIKFSVMRMFSAGVDSNP